MCEALCCYDILKFYMRSDGVKSRLALSFNSHNDVIPNPLPKRERDPTMLSDRHRHMQDEHRTDAYGGVDPEHHTGGAS
jgi:hypothetical protein